MRDNAGAGGGQHTPQRGLAQAARPPPLRFGQRQLPGRRVVCEGAGGHHAVGVYHVAGDLMNLSTGVIILSRRLRTDIDTGHNCIHEDT